jgi:RNase P subunit RPR2
MEKKGLRYCDKCKSLLVEHESWFVEIASEHLCVCCAENEIVGLRDQLRWRIWPNEEPNKTGQYLVLDCRGLAEVSYWEMDEEESEGRWIPFPDELRYWRPISPLPGGE